MILGFRGILVISMVLGVFLTILEVFESILVILEA